MMAAFYLFRIEFRRNLGLWLLPIMVFLTGALALEEATSADVVLWPRVSRDILFSSNMLGPLAGALAAWMAGRNHRRKVEELLSTTPYPGTARDATTLGGTVAWALLAYVLGALVVVAALAPQATWGTPDASPVVVGLFTVLALAAVGYAAGSLLRSRFVAPTVAVVLLVAFILPREVDRLFFSTAAEDGGVRLGWVARALSPLEWDWGDVFYRVAGPTVPLILWLLGLSALALAALSLRHRTIPVALGLAGTGGVVAVTGAVMLVSTSPTVAWTKATPIPFDPVGAGQEFPVCVHPAYEPMLPETAALVAGIAEPFARVPGGPVRAEQVSSQEGFELRADGTLAFSLFGGQAEYGYLAFNVARALTGGGQGLEVSEAQIVVRRWLLERAGINPDDFGLMSYDQRVLAATAQFAAVDEATRRAWLAEHYAALRAGELTLEDLP